MNKKLTAKYEGPYRILEVNNNATAVIKDNSGGKKLVDQSRLKPPFETMIRDYEERVNIQNVDETKTMQSQIKDSTDIPEEIVRGWGQFEQLAEEEEELHPVSDEPATNNFNRSANRRGSTEEEEQWEPGEIPPTNERTESEVRPRIRNRRAIHPPTKLDL